MVKFVLYLVLIIKEKPVEIIIFVIGLFIVSAFPSLVALGVVRNNLTKEEVEQSPVLTKIISSIVMQLLFIMFFIAYTFDYFIFKIFLS